MRKNKFKLNKDQIKKLCQSGSQAPSGGNVQPWKVKVKENKFEIYLDPERSTSFIDVERTASIFSIGCFTENIEQTATHLNLNFKTNINNHSLTTRPLVTIEFSQKTTKNNSQSLYSYINERCTNRKVHNGQLIDKQQIQKIKKQIKSQKKFEFKSTSDEIDKEIIAKILGEADVVRTINNQGFKQMIDEFRWDPKSVKKTMDGLDIKTLELPPADEKGLRLIKSLPFMRYIIPNKIFRDNAKPLLTGCSHICTLCTQNEITPELLFQAGKIIQKIWLYCTKNKIYLHPWAILPFFIFRIKLVDGHGFSTKEINQINKITSEFQKAFKLSPKSTPLFIFRLSYAEPPSARSLKRPWTEFTTID